jgi:2-amino-4-hydroxy-6-hydroxymethyldihydropteridine diphosphokinase
MNTAYLLTGGNIGDKKGNLIRAGCLIEQYCGSIKNRSALYETSAWGNTSQPSFLNQALEIETSLTARQLVRKILKLEKQMGRVRSEKMGPRIIDIDILFFNREIHTTRLLTIPHPQLPYRRFALIPLAEIAPSYIHPVLNLSVAILLQQCLDNLDVKRVAE